MIIGQNAGKLWRYLSDHSDRKCAFEETAQALGLSASALSAAIGWLAREDKVQIEFSSEDGNEVAFIYLIQNVYF